MSSMSLRWRLPLSYAAIALLAVLALGAVLLLTLRSVYQRLELEYLIANADVIADSIATPLHTDSTAAGFLQAQIAGLSFLTQTRVRVTDSSGATVFADSGDAGATDGSTRIAIDVTVGDVAQTFSQSVEQEGNRSTTTYSSSIVVEDAVFSRDLENTIVVDEPSGDQVEILPESRLPTIGTLFGFGLDPALASSAERSGIVVRRPVLAPGGDTAGYVELSQGPAAGRDILRSVARGWAVAGLVAVLLAALLGWLVSGRITRPLLALTAVTQQMAHGDLSVRAKAGGQDEIGILTRSFNDMAGRVEDTVDTLQRFVADAAHELQTPLTAAHSDLDLLAESADSSQRARIIRIREQTVRLERLTAGLLELSRLETDGSGGKRTDVELVHLLTAVCEPFASRAEQAGVDLTLDLPEQPLVMRADERRLSQAIGDLLDNALKFTPSGGAIVVRLFSGGSSAVLEVADSGIGVPEADLPYLFARFHRGSNAAPYPGSGLGLAIVRAIAEGHGGNVAIRSGKEGTLVTLRLPLDAAGQEEPRDARARTLDKGDGSS